MSPDRYSRCASGPLDGTRTSAARLPTPHRTWAGAHDPGSSRLALLTVGAPSATCPAALASSPATMEPPVADKEPSAVASPSTLVPVASVTPRCTCRPQPGRCPQGFGLNEAMQQCARLSRVTASP